MMPGQITLVAPSSEVIIGKTPMVVIRSITTTTSTCTMKRTTTASWKIITNITDLPLIINILANTHDNICHLALVEEAVAAAPSIEAMHIRMSLLGTMAEAMKALAVMATIGLNGGLRRMVMTWSDSRIIRYVGDTLVKAVVSEGLSSVDCFAVRIIISGLVLCFW
jgi:hypothetical protein